MEVDAARAGTAILEALAAFGRLPPGVAVPQAAQRLLEALEDLTARLDPGVPGALASRTASKLRPAADAARAVLDDTLGQRLSAAMKPWLRELGAPAALSSKASRVKAAPRGGGTKRAPPPSSAESASRKSARAAADAVAVVQAPKRGRPAKVDKIVTARSREGEKAHPNQKPKVDKAQIIDRNIRSKVYKMLQKVCKEKGRQGPADAQNQLPMVIETGVFREFAHSPTEYRRKARETVKALKQLLEKDQDMSNIKVQQLLDSVRTQCLKDRKAVGKPSPKKRKALVSQEDLDDARSVSSSSDGSSADQDSESDDHHSSAKHVMEEAEDID